jgi:hypothetical protein
MASELKTGVVESQGVQAENNDGGESVGTVQTDAATADDTNSQDDKMIEPDFIIPPELRKSARNRNKVHQVPTTKHTATKNRSRRSIFKRYVYRSPSAFVSPVTSNNIFFRGIYLQSGDIVALTDIEGGIYYAQLRGFLQDQYCEKSAAITWLVPTTSSPADGSFDAATFILGPEEDIPRKLETMQFVMHAPSDYFKPTAAYPTESPSQTAGFIWTRAGTPRLINRSELVDMNIEV